TRTPQPPAHPSRVRSRVSVTLPNSLSAASLAVLASSPSRTRSAIAIDRCERISSCRSSSRRLLVHQSRNRMASPFRVVGAEDGADRCHELRPSIALLQQLLLAGERQAIELRALI